MAAPTEVSATPPVSQQERQGRPKTAFRGCPICGGKGKWLGYSDREWTAHGPRKPPTTMMKCGYCRGLGRIKHLPPETGEPG